MKGFSQVKDKQAPYPVSKRHYILGFIRKFWIYFVVKISSCLHALMEFFLKTGFSQFRGCIVAIDDSKRLRNLGQHSVPLQITVSAVIGKYVKSVIRRFSRPHRLLSSVASFPNVSVYNFQPFL